MGKTSIEWCDRSINPLRARNRHTGAVGHYCELVSSGCKNCYSSNFQPRFKMPTFGGKTKPQPLKPDANGYIQINEDLDVFLDEAKLHEVLRTKKPQKFFWADMTDMFGWWVPDEWLDKIFATMAIAWHVHQVLTKRPERAHEYLTALGNDFPRLERAARTLGYTLKWSEIPLVGWPLNSVWLGISAEDQPNLEARTHWLLRTPAAVRFVSAEPLLGPLDFEKLRLLDGKDGCGYNALRMNDDNRYYESPAALDWVIIGGESGRGARPCDIEWIRSIVQQCNRNDVAAFVKQAGAKPFDHEMQPAGGWWPDQKAFYRDVLNHQEVLFRRLKDSKGGDIEELPEDLRVREFPARVRA